MVGAARQFPGLLVGSVGFAIQWDMVWYPGTLVFCGYRATHELYAVTANVGGFTLWHFN